MNLPALVDLTSKTAKECENMLAAATAFGSTKTIARIEAELERREVEAAEERVTRSPAALPWATISQPANA